MPLIVSLVLKLLMRMQMDSNESPWSGTSTTPARMTTFLRAIVERAGGFSYPPKVGTHRRPRSSLGSSSSSTQAGVNPSVHPTATLPVQAVATPSRAPLLQAPVKFITRGF